MNKQNRQYDVCVIGAGPGGISAALAAARNGAKVLLVEQNGYVGGNLVIGLPLLGYLDKDGYTVTAGIAQELVDALAERNATFGHRWCPMHNSVTLYDHEQLKIILFEKLLEDISFNAGGDEMPNVYLNINGDYVVEHLGKDEVTMDMKRYIL